ncbi:MAG: hypothetical protein M1381_04360 [Deltaproteobacteria bacterium]|nr:hypothetical protein [Deltaproteobacteria bacterium]
MMKHIFKHKYIYSTFLLFIFFLLNPLNVFCAGDSLLSSDSFSSYYDTHNMKDIDATLSELNRQMIKLKGRLLLFGEGIVYSISQGAPVQINLNTYFPHGDFVPKKIAVYIDGFKLNIPGSTSLAKAKDMIFNGPIVPGKHSVEVYVLLQTSGFLGIGEGKNYNFTATGTLDARPGVFTHLDIVCIDTGKGDTPARTSVKFEQSVRQPPGIK